MDFAVNFDDELGSNADKINDEEVDGVLAAKLYTLPRTTQVLPEDVLGGSGMLVVFTSVNFGFVSSTHISSVDMKLVPE